MATLNELVLECLERMEEEGSTVVDAVCARHPEHATGIRRRLSTLSRMGLLEDAEGGELEEFPERLGEYRLLERLGGGGMGVVYLAEQEPLGRRVALKLVRPEQLYFSGARERFAREVDTVAHLHHPAIVPIYTVGEEGGVPYFAMQHIAGGTLEQVLSELRGARPERLSGRDLARAVAAAAPGLAPDAADSSGYVFGGSWEAACLHVVHQVADALVHAHERGVLHRDIKPSNVMLTPAGRAMLLDFGLASSEGATRLTRTGSQLGSIPYMSPEQARGGFDDVRAASDVYSLGVTLYELLTLRHAFSGDSSPALLLAIQNGVERPVRALNPNVSWEAETVCATAMDVDAERRYASMADFAHDLSNVLERRPIEARRAGPLLRARRWVERHRAATVAIVLAAVVAIGGPIVFALQQRGASLRVERQRDRAEANLERALEAIERTLTQVGAIELRDVPQMEQVRRSLVITSVELLDGLAAQDDASPKVRRAIADTRILLAGVQRDLGEFEAARATALETLPVFQELSDEHPDDRAARLALARARIQEGTVHEEMDRLDDAGAAYLDARDEARALLAETPADPELALTVGTAQASYGRLARKLGEYRAAEGELRGALETLGAYAEDDAILFEMGRCHAHLGDLFLTERRLDEAAEAYGEALRLDEALLEHSPDSVELQSALAAHLMNLGSVHMQADAYEEAEALLERCAGLHASLAEEFPENPHHRDQLATTIVSLANLFVLAKSWDRADDASTRAVELFGELTGAHPEVADFESALGSALHLRAHAGYFLERDAAVTVGLLEEAVRHQHAALALSPESVDYGARLKDHYFVLAFQLSLQPGTYLRRAQVLEALFELVPGEPESAEFVARGLAACARAAAEDQTLEASVREARERDWTSVAIAALGAAAAAGHVDSVRALLEDTALDPVAASPAGRDLSAALAAERRPVSPEDDR